MHDILLTKISYLFLLAIMCIDVLTYVIISFSSIAIHAIVSKEIVKILRLCDIIN